MKTSSKTSRLLVGAVATVTFAVMAIAPASAAQRHDTQDVGHDVSYVALGDSYAYGLGADNPLTQSYPAVLAARAGLTLTNASKSGATTSDVRRSIQVPGNLAALKQAGLVTVTAGGDDLQALQVAAICKELPAACETAIARALAKLPALYTSLGLTFQAIRTAAPHAEIVVTGYPQLIDPSLGTQAQQLNAASIALNTTIRAAVWKSRTHGGNVRFVSVVIPFLGHGIGSADSWINPPGVAAAAHPTTIGYRKGYYCAIARSLAVSRFLMARAA